VSRWQYLICDLVTGAVVDELPLTGVRMSKLVNGSGQFGATLRLGDLSVSQQRDAYALTRPVRNTVCAVRDGVPWWGGIIWASDYNSEQHTVTLAGADFWSYFDHRKVVEVLPTPPLATTYVAGLTYSQVAVEQNQLARNLVALAQSHTGGNIGITFDSASSGMTRDRTYQGYDLDYVGEALRELAAVIDGPDIRFDVAGFDGNGRPVRRMLTGTPRLGQTGTPHRWDYGANLDSFVWSSGGGAMANRAYAQGDGEERGSVIAVAADYTRIVDGWPLLETDDIYDGTVDPSVLQGHANAVLGALKLPLVTPTLIVRGDLTPNLSEWAPGDDAQMNVQAGHEFFRTGLQITVRMLGVDVDVSDDGVEKATISCRSTTEVV
jgi:hypothetical protein